MGRGTRPKASGSNTRERTGQSPVLFSLPVREVEAATLGLSGNPPFLS
jgi:hypothetical protein